MAGAAPGSVRAAAVTRMAAERRMAASEMRDEPTVPPGSSVALGLPGLLGVEQRVDPARLRRVRTHPRDEEHEEEWHVDALTHRPEDGARGVLVGVRPAGPARVAVQGVPAVRE